jgi:hypothetical protein
MGIGCLFVITRRIYSPELLFEPPKSLLLELEEPASLEADVEAAGAASLLSLLVSAPALTGAGLAALFAPDLLSVTYQPEPLNTIPAGVITRRSLFLLHSGQRLSGSSLNDCCCSNCTPQFSQRYV